MLRKLMVHRKKALSGSILRFHVYLDGKEVGRLGNDKTLEFDVSTLGHELMISAEGVPNRLNLPVKLLIPPSTEDAKCELFMETKFFSSEAKWVLELQGNGAERGKILEAVAAWLADFMLHESMARKFQEIRNSGGELLVQCDFGEVSILMSLEEKSGIPLNGEPLDMPYSEMTLYGINRRSDEDLILREISMASKTEIRQMALYFEKAIISSPAHSHLTTMCSGNRVTVAMK